MKTKAITYVICCLSFGSLLSQELRPMPLDIDTLVSKAIDFNYEEDLSQTFTVMQICDMYNFQLLNYKRNGISIGMSSRLEEELPYENNGYDFNGFYYFDLGITYAINRFNLSCSIENILNLKSDNFSIDPILETSNGSNGAFFFSHESDTLIKFAICYNF